MKYKHTTEVPHAMLFPISMTGEYCGKVQNEDDNKKITSTEKLFFQPATSICEMSVSQISNSHFCAYVFWLSCLDKVLVCHLSLYSAPPTVQM